MFVQRKLRIRKFIQHVCVCVCVCVQYAHTNINVRTTVRLYNSINTITYPFNLNTFKPGT